MAYGSLRKAPAEGFAARRVEHNQYGRFGAHTGRSVIPLAHTTVENAGSPKLSPHFLAKELPI